MYYIVETAKTFAQASADLAVEVGNLNFSVLHIHDMGETLRNKGQKFTEECKVFEVCSPSHANAVLQIDLRVNMALPCRISVYTENGVTKIGLIKPAAMLLSLSDDPGLAAIAREIEELTMQMVTKAQ